MAYSTFERWSGSAWVNEPNLVRLTVSEKLYSPSAATVVLADPAGTVLTNYYAYQKVRIKEGGTKIILFYGKIHNMVPENDGQYGSILVIEARDNLAELEDVSFKTDYSTSQNSNWLRKDTLIKDIINGYSSTHPAHAYTGNITTTTAKTRASAVSEATARKWNFSSERSGKNVLGAISNLSIADPHSANREAFGHVFHLDYRTSGNTVYSDFNYFKKGDVPSGTTSTYGLTAQFGAAEGNQVKSMFSDYTFDSKNTKELITKVYLFYVDDNKKPQSLNFILVNTGAHSGTFTQDESISWSGGHTANLRMVGGSGSTRHIIISDFTEAGIKALPGLQVTGTTSSETATANATSATPPGVLSVLLEHEISTSIQLSDFETLDELYKHVQAVLYQTNDSVEHAEFRVSKWPYMTVAGTHTGSDNASVLTDSTKTLTNSSFEPGSMIENTTDGSSAEVTAIADTQVTGTLSGGTGNDWDTDDAYKLYKLLRVGHSLQVVISRASINKEMLVTSITYEEGGGVIESTIEVGGVTRGSAGRLTTRTVEVKKLRDSGGGLRNKLGPLAQQEMQWSSDIKLTETDYNTVAWSTGAITFGDGTVYTMDAGNTGNMSATTPYYIYLDSDTSATVLQSTTTAATYKGPNKTLLFTALAGVAAGDPPQIRPQQGSVSSPGAKTYYQSSAPSSTATTPLRSGDLWVDSTNGSMLKRWSGSAWVDSESFLNNTWTNAGRTKVVGGKIETNLIVLSSATGSAANTANIIQNLTTSPSSSSGSGAGSNRILLAADGIFGYNSSNALNFSITQAGGGSGYFGTGAGVLNADGLTIATAGDPTENPAAGQVKADINTISFGWHASSLSSALDTKYVSLGGFYDAAPNNMTANAFAFIWFHGTDGSLPAYLQMHDFNRGTIGNLTAISSGSIYATESGNNAGNRQFWRPPSNVDTRDDQTDGTNHSANLEGVLRITKDVGSTGRGDLPWGTEWALPSSLFKSDLYFSTGLGASEGPTSKYGVFRYITDGGGGSADTLAFTSGQTNADVVSSNAESAFWTMLSESDGSGGSRLIFEPIVDWNVAKNHAWIGWHNPLYGIQSYYFNGGDGNAAYPAHTFSSETGTGMWRYTSSQLAFSTGGTGRFLMTADGFMPYEDSVYDLGKTLSRFVDIHADNGAIQTSDMREKTQILPTKLGLDFINALNPVSYKWKSKPEKQTHYGLLAQEVIETLKDNGIDYIQDFGGITGDDDTSYGARYGEFVPILIKAVQELSEKIKSIEGR